jgi:PKHD-type hydroxylase
MILNYSYFYFVSALSPELCDSIIEYGLEKMAQAKAEHGESAIVATTGDWRHKQSDSINESAKSITDLTIEEVVNAGEEPEDIYVRDSNVSWISERWAYEAIWPYVHEANYQAGWNFDWDYTEDMQFTKYGPNQFYGWHADAGPHPYEKFDPNIHEYAKDRDGNPISNAQGEYTPLNGHYTDVEDQVGKIRKLSVTVSLSDPADYEGGNLKFDLGPHRPDRYHTCEEIRPRGSIIVFPSHIHHQVTPVTKGTRYSLVAWNLGRPFR